MRTTPPGRLNSFPSFARRSHGTARWAWPVLRNEPRCQDPFAGAQAYWAVVLRAAVPRSSRVWLAAAFVGVAIAVAAFEAIFGDPVARGDLVLRFRVPVAHPGQTLVAFLGDTNGRSEHISSKLTGIQTYLVPARDRISPLHQIGTGPPSSVAWMPLGPIRKSPDGSAFVRFRIPSSLTPGVYTIGFWCIPCAAPKGATFTGSYPSEQWKPGVKYQKLLRVVALKPTGGTSWKGWEVTALAVGGIAAVLGALLFCRRSAAPRA